MYWEPIETDAEVKRIIKDSPMGGITEVNYIRLFDFILKKIGTLEKPTEKKPEKNKTKAGKK